MTITDSKYKDIIAKYFNYTGDFQFLDLVATIIDRVDDLTDEDDIYYTIDSELSWYNNQWTVAKYYCDSPAELNWDAIIDEFFFDLTEICNIIIEKQKEKK